MSASSNGLSMDSNMLVDESCRREPRMDVVRIVEYTHFPRVDSESTPRLAFTRDVSASGMCIGADEPEPTDTMLRVTLRGVDGDPGITVVDRVVWCSPTQDGRWWIGLESMTDKHLS